MGQWDDETIIDPITVSWSNYYIDRLGMKHWDSGLMAWPFGYFKLFFTELLRK